MGKALSGDLRSRVVKASDEGMSARQAAARLGVGVSSAIRWIARAKIGELMPRPQGRRCAASLDVHEAFIVGMIEERKDITLNEMCGSAGDRAVGKDQPQRPERLARPARLDVQKSPRMHWSRTVPTS